MRLKLYILNLSLVLVIASKDMANTFHDLLLRDELLKLLLEYMSTNDIAFLMRSSREGNTEIENQIHKHHPTLTRAQYIETNFDESYLYKWIRAYSKRLMGSPSRNWVQQIYINLWSPCEFDQIDAIGNMTYVLNVIVRDNREWDSRGVGLHKDMWQIQRDLMQYGFYRRATMLLRTSESDLERHASLVVHLYDFVEIAARIRVTLRGARRDKNELASARCRARALMQQLKPKNVAIERKQGDNWNLPRPTKANETVRHKDNGELLKEIEEEEEEFGSEWMFEDMINPHGSEWLFDEAVRFEDNDELLTEIEEEEYELGSDGITLFRM